MNKLFNRYFSRSLFLYFIAICFIGLNLYVSLIAMALIFINDTVQSKVRFRIDACFVVLMASVLLFSRTGIGTGRVSVHNAMWYTSFSFLSYTIGRDMIAKCRTWSDVYVLWFFIFLILALPNIPITLYDVLVNGLVNPERALAVAGDESDQRAVTGRTIELAMAISGIFMVFIPTKIAEIKKTRQYYIILAVVAEICTLHYVSRTGVAILVIAFILGLLLLSGVSRRTAAVILAVAILYYLLQYTAIAGVFADREIEGSDMASAGGRSSRWLLGLTMLLANPSGFSTLEMTYAHNFWLDYGMEGGLYAFLLMVLFSIMGLWKVIMLYFKKVAPDYVGVSALIFTTIFLASIFTEPIHKGSLAMMYTYFLFTAMVVELCRRVKSGYIFY